MAEFQHGLFGCFDNCTVCLYSFFVPCYVEGKIAEKVGESCIMHALLVSCCGPCIRQKVREQKNIAGSFGMDLLVFCFCNVCAIAQEAHEVNALDGQSMARE
jgi:Cys-rich protein (TIGR01571 family)